MIGINRQTDYAARLILYLAAKDPDERATAQSIAKYELIPSAFVRRIVTRLSNAGLLETTKGRTGGVELARPASQISLLDVIEAIEGPLVLNECTEDPSICPFTEFCPVHGAFEEARTLLEEKLRTYTFDKLAEKLKKALAQRDRVAA
jgi:Rrf2 family protein